MNHFLRLLWKETRELLRPRYLLPILLIPVMFVALGQGIGGIEDGVDEQPSIGILNADDGEYGDLVNASLSQNASVVYYAESGEPSAAVETVSGEGGDALIVIPDGFTERIRERTAGSVGVHSVVRSLSLSGITSSAQIDGQIQRAGTVLTLNVTGTTPAMLNPIRPEYTTYLEDKTLENTSPGALSGSFATQFIFIPVVIMFVIIFSGQMVINSMGAEKENKTLETLLTMPVKRSTIVAAKLIGSASIGLLGAALYTVSIYYYQSSFTDGAASAALSLGVVDYAIVGVSLFLSLVGVLALALILGVFAGDRQGAQMLLFPISILAIVPMFATMFTDVAQLSLPIRALLLAIPFTHPAIAPKRLLLNDTTMVFGGIVYEAIFAVAMIWLAIRVFNSDRLITGSSGRIGQWLSRLQQ
ncbi:ABC-2 type transporter protein [Halorhabdus tiamatea SARL4B]|uniref:ABC-2 type transporter protein n=1 Tax=Halorhabdus tiamatea SARL4B TaxID=1033806 RepID=F7PNL7_9EURY|nr:ABC transporter permease [Halorhabdus tiamatea]ERJ05288.1 ABC-2 type transporter protein [Halorhabdus tiamatea SARL4B]CCQ33747.1 ABC-2 type transporter, permease protein [Halorhabdus tiamatea SARL4B]